MAKRIILVVFILLINTITKSQQVLVLDSEKKTTIGHYTSILKDPSKQLTIEEILKEGKIFTPYKKNVFSSLSPHSDYWIKLQVKKTTKYDYYLVIDNPYISQIDLYVIENETPKLLYKSGNQYPFSQRAIQRNNFLFPIELPYDKTQTFYIRYRSTWRMELPMSIQERQIAIEQIPLQDLWYGAFYGITITAFIYNFFIFLVIRDKNYFFYLGALLALGLFRAISNGLLFQYLFPNSAELNIFLLPASLSLVGIFITHFTIEFLNTKKRLPSFHKGLYLFDIIFVALYIISFISVSVWAISANIVLMLFPIYLIIIGIEISGKGYTPARYYYIGTVFYFIIILVAVVRNVGLLPYSFIAFNFGDVALVMLAIFYSLALGDRYNLLEKEKKDYYIKHTIELEEEMKEKNHLEEELQSLNKNLKATNNDLDGFIYSASHELKVPIMNIEGLLSLIHSDPHNEKEVKDNLGMMRASVLRFENTVNDLQLVTKIQRIKNEEEGLIEVSELLKDIEFNLSNELQKSEATIESHLNGCPKIRFSRDNLYRILNTLIVNAIKFRSPARPLKIKIESLENTFFCIIQISDNGLGINKDNLSKIFSLFKRAHAHVEGRGLGLYILKRIIENAGGKIEVASEEGKGSTFYAYFRKTSTEST